MLVWPKSLYSLGLSLRTAGMERKLRQHRAGIPDQQRILQTLLPSLAATTVWGRLGVESGMSYETFRERVPLQTYEQLAPAIARMTQGESDVLWPGRCALFALTAGTTTGERRPIPMTEEMLGTVRRAGLDALLYYTVRVRHAAVFRGRHLLFGGTTALQKLNDQPEAAYAGDLSGIAALSLPAWADKHLYEPGAQLAQIEDWNAQLEAVINRTKGRDISLLAGLPQWTLSLALALRESCSVGRRRMTNLQAIWPNFECYIHTGTPVAPLFDPLREVMGPTVKFHEVYAATEAFVAAQDCEAMQGLRLMDNAGTFFEFLPMTEFAEASAQPSRGDAIPLAEVKTGIDYALVVTNATGLARYLLGDIVRFASVSPPRIHYVGRTALRLDTVDERVTEKELTEALVAVCRRRNWTIVNFHVAPHPSPGNHIVQRRGGHEWWIELRPGTATTPTGPQIANDLDGEMVRLNETYGGLRRSGNLVAPVVRLVMPGVFEHWARFRTAWGGLHQMPRSRPDRLIADELSEITHFASD
jgi:hypothetical protein